MAWRDRLLKASFRGEKFEIADHSARVAGRRHTRLVSLVVKLTGLAVSGAVTAASFGRAVFAP